MSAPKAIAATHTAPIPAAELPGAGIAETKNASGALDRYSTPNSRPAHARVLHSITTLLSAAARCG